MSKRLRSPETRGAPPSILLPVAAALATLTGSVHSRAADIIVNGSFVNENFEVASGWRAVDDKSGTIHQAIDFAPWSDDDAEPNYGAILRVCQDATDVAGASGGVWGAHIEQTVSLVAGRSYNLSFWAADLVPNQFDPACALHAYASKALQIQVYGESSGELLNTAVNVASCGTTCGSSHSYEFTAPADDTAVLKFFFGGQWAKLKLSTVVLDEGAPADGGGTSGVSLNQLGYLRAGPKLATVRSASAEALAWELVDAEGTPLESGTSTPFGADALSGDTLQRIDFGAWSGSGSGLRLRVDGASSSSFDVRDDVYAALARDSLRFYYYQRCGQALGSPEAEAAAFARGIDHTGDGAALCSAGQSCDVGYPLDVSKGWHDAGDYGKYVVSGSLAVWTLLNAYERATRWGTSLGAFDDGELNTGAANGVPDVLDEARQELEFLLGMQVPAGNPLAGMAHHKFHSDDWVPMPTHPNDDASARFLRPPSTAATLDLAATAAQCARIWRDVDAAFSGRCLDAAERAWAAALAHPDLYAPSNSTVGGGPYDDGYVGDELYWAAAELFITTGGAEYADPLRSSSHFGGFNVGTGSGPFSWPGTSGLGTISLALVPNDLGASELVALRQAIVDEADIYLDVADGNGYGVALGGVIWGSNGDALNAGILLAFAHDLTGDPRFLSGAAGALDYVLGKNPLDRSYVTGYGTSPVTKIHHTTFAPYLDAAFPAPPPGFIVGGPNASLDAFPDPGVSPGCSPLRCFSEASGAYWFIEVAVNWNAPLAWLSHWLDEHGQSPRTTPIGVDPSSPGGSGGAGSGGAGGTSNGGGGGSAATDPDLSNPTMLDSTTPGGSTPATSEAGCACRTTPARSTSSGAGGLLIALAVAGARRRHRQRSSQIPSVTGTSKRGRRDC